MDSRRRLTVALTIAALALTGCGGGGDDGGDDGGDVAAASGGSEVTIGAGDIYYADDGQQSNETDVTFTASAGEVVITLENDGALPHNVVIEEAGDTKVADAAAGASDTGSVELEPGTYTIYCDVAGHREAGMEATLVVE